MNGGRSGLAMTRRTVRIARRVLSAFPRSSDRREPVGLGQFRSPLVLLEEWQEHLGDDQALSSENPAPLKVDLTGRERQPDRHQPDWIVEKYFGPTIVNASSQ